MNDEGIKRAFALHRSPFGVTPPDATAVLTEAQLKKFSSYERMKTTIEQIKQLTPPKPTDFKP